MSQLLLRLQESVDSVSRRAKVKQPTELLYLRELTFVGGFSKGHFSLQSSQSHESFLWTCIDRGFIERYSFVGMSDCDRKYIPDPRRQLFRNTHREPQSFELNTSENVNSIYAQEDLSDHSKATLLDLERDSSSFYHQLLQGFPTWETEVSFHKTLLHSALINSKGILWTSFKEMCDVGYSMTSQKDNVYKSGYTFNVPSVLDTLPQAKSSPELTRDAQLPQTFIRKGTGPMLLSPWVTEVLCQLVFNMCKTFNLEDRKILDALPPEFELFDDPSVGLGARSGMFDHEGSPTSKKILCKNQERVTTVSDLKSSTHKKESKSSGNGFRSSMFLSQPSDVTPSIHPNYLRLSKGKMGVKSIFNDIKDFIYLTDLSIPTDRFQDLNKPGALVTLRGYRVSNGKMVSRVFGRNLPDRLLISAPPKSFGTLIDPSAQILKEGTWTRTGWFPYIFLPRYTWS